MPNCKEAVTIDLRQLLDVADGADEAVRQGQQVDAVFLYGRIFMHDEDVVEEIVDSADAFGQDISRSGVIVNGVRLGQSRFHSLAGGVQRLFFVRFKQGSVDSRVFRILDHVAYAGKGLEQFRLAHEVGVDEGLGAAGALAALSVSSLRTQSMIW